MRKVGKYEKMRKNAIMQTYITSLLCLVLCVTMFFGTTMAWFTDTTASEGNEMYVGTLDVALNHASFANGSLGAYEEVKDNYKVFDTIENGGIRWEPGYTAVEKFELTENGDLAFSYQMSIARTFAETGDEAQKAIAQAITVWSYVGDDAETVTTLPVNFEELTAGQWEEIGTLYDVITEKLPVFKGQMDKDAVTKTKTEGQGEQQKTVDDPAKAYHLIALHMDKNFDGFIKDATGAPTEATVQGQTLDNITIKLVATQLPSEQDAFGNTYDAGANEFIAVNDAEELIEAFAAGDNVILNKDITLPANKTVTVPEGATTLDLNGKTLTADPACVGISVNGELTVKNGTMALTAPADSNSGSGIISVESGSVVTLENVKIELDGGLSHAITMNGGTLNLNNDSEVIIKGSGYQTGIISFAVTDVLNINGGKITIAAPADSVTAVGVGTYGNLTVNANSGTLSVNTGTNHYGMAPFTGGTMTVNLSNSFAVNVEDGATGFESDVVVNQ